MVNSRLEVIAEAQGAQEVYDAVETGDYSDIALHRRGELKSIVEDEGQTEVLRKLESKYDVSVHEDRPSGGSALPPRDGDAPSLEASPPTPERFTMSAREAGAVMSEVLWAAEEPRSAINRTLDEYVELLKRRDDIGGERDAYVKTLREVTNQMSDTPERFFSIFDNLTQHEKERIAQQNLSGTPERSTDEGFLIPASGIRTDIDGMTTLLDEVLTEVGVLGDSANDARIILRDMLEDKMREGETKVTVQDFERAMDRGGVPLDRMQDAMRKFRQRGFPETEKGEPKALPEPDADLSPQEREIRERMRKGLLAFPEIDAENARDALSIYDRRIREGASGTPFGLAEAALQDARVRREDRRAIRDDLKSIENDDTGHPITLGSFSERDLKAFRDVLFERAAEINSEGKSFAGNALKEATGELVNRSLPAPDSMKESLLLREINKMGRWNSEQGKEDEANEWFRLATAIENEQEER